MTAPYRLLTDVEILDLFTKAQEHLIGLTARDVLLFRLEMA
jgi:hypothetical protein